MFLAVILATAAGGALAYAGKYDEAPDATLMRTGGACNAPEFDFDATLVANEQRYRARAMRGDEPELGADDAATPAPAASGDSAADPSPDAPFDADEFQALAAPWILVALVGSFFLGLLMLWMFRQCAHTMVWTVIYAKVAVTGAVAAMFLVQGALIPAIIFAFFTALSAFCFYLWTNELNLIASLLQVATQGLRDNPHVITTTVGLSVVSLLYIAPAVAAMMFAAENGHVAVSTVATAKSGDGCVDFVGAAVDCCGFQVDPWVPYYMTLSIVSLLWVTSAALETRLYVIGGTMCQWYFAPAGTTDFSGVVWGSLSNALGPSFGTICFGSFVLTMTEMAKAATERLRREERENILVCLCAAVMECVYALVEYISKFAVLQASMTGEAFCDAAASATDILSRNFLMAYGTYAFPSMILQGAALVLALGCGVLTWTLAWAQFAATNVVNASMYAAIVGALCGVVAFVALTFFVMIALNVVDAVFLCYALDKDRNMVNHAEFHAVFEEVNRVAPQPVSAPGAVVQQPGGGGEERPRRPRRPRRAHAASGIRLPGVRGGRLTTRMRESCDRSTLF